MAKVTKYNVLDENGVDQLVKDISKEVDKKYVRQTTYETVASSTKDGLMSAKDKATFDLNALSQEDIDELSAMLD